MLATNLQGLARRRSDLGDDCIASAAHDGPTGACDHPSKASNPDAHRRPANHERAECADSRSGDEHLSAAAPAELIAVAPRRELGTQRRANANERRSIAQLRE